MKKILLVTILCLFFSAARAQFAFSGQWAFAASGGISAPNSGWNVNMGFDKAFGLSIHGLQFRLGYGNIPVRKSNVQFNIDRVSAHINYAVSFDQMIRSRWFFLNLTGGISAGYDILPKYASESIKINTPSSYLLGVNFAPAFEFKLSNVVHLFIEPRITYYFIYAAYNYEFNANIGVKFYL